MDELNTSLFDLIFERLDRVSGVSVIDSNDIKGNRLFSFDDTDSILRLTIPDEIKDNLPGDVDPDMEIPHCQLNLGDVTSVIDKSIDFIASVRDILHRTDEGDSIDLPDKLNLMARAGIVSMALVYGVIAPLKKAGVLEPADGHRDDRTIDLAPFRHAVKNMKLLTDEQLYMTPDTANGTKATFTGETKKQVTELLQTTQVLQDFRKEIQEVAPTLLEELVVDNDRPLTLYQFFGLAHHQLDQSATTPIADPQPTAQASTSQPTTP